MHHHLLLRVITKLLCGMIILFAFYVQFHGDFSPGGGFQAGVIMAVAFILYGVVFGIDNAKLVCPPWLVHKLMALGVIVYAGTGIFSMILGFEFLDYGAFKPDHQSHGQHWGILAVELGVGITVTGVMISVYFAFATRQPGIKDEEW